MLILQEEIDFFRGGNDLSRRNSGLGLEGDEFNEFLHGVTSQKGGRAEILGRNENQQGEE